jgi:regulator of sigma E protease
MSEPKRALNSRRLLFWVVIAALLTYLVISKMTVFGNVLIVVIGSGAMILVHELGHFTAAKLSGIKVEAFSIGMGPVLIGLSRSEAGYRVRILPGLVKNPSGEPGEGGLCFTFGKKAKPGETEYRISLIPFGGFVKMLGQEDIVQVEKSDDPRSFANKPVGSRLAVIASGVLFNAISAILLFMITFMIGIDFPPAIVGGVVDGSPAAKAGLRAGDEIIEIDGRSKDLDFRDIVFAALLSDWAEEVPFKVRHKDGSVEQVYLAAKKIGGDPMKKFGIEWPISLEIAEVTDPKALARATGLRPGDRIISVNGKDVEYFWELEEIINDSYAPVVSMLAERHSDSNDAIKLVETEIPLVWPVETVSGLANVCSMVPRLRVRTASTPEQSFVDRILFNIETLLAQGGIGQEPARYKLKLEPNDIIISVGDVNYPTYYELRDVTDSYENKDLPMTVLRTDDSGMQKTVDIVVRPMRRGKRVIIGLLPMLDVEHPIVAKTIEADSNTAGFIIPPGATITAVDGTEVSDFLAVAKQIAQSSEGEVIIRYISADGKEGLVALDAANKQELVKMEPMFAVQMPFATMEITHKAEGPIEAISMGSSKTIRMIVMTYASFKVILTGQVGGEGVMGPVGILHFSYETVSTRPLIYYVYWMAFLSVAIAVFNFLPMLPLDGGWALFLVIEKIKGSAVNPKILTAAAGFGWILIGALFIFLTFNDVARWIGTLF